MQTAFLPLLLVLAAAPEVKLPPKSDVIPALESSRPELAQSIRNGVKAARSNLEKCLTHDGGPDCFCTVLKKVRFDVTLDGGTVTVSYPIQGHTGGPSFTIDSSGKVVDCREK